MIRWEPEECFFWYRTHPQSVKSNAPNFNFWSERVYWGMQRRDNRQVEAGIDNVVIFQYNRAIKYTICCGERNGENGFVNVSRTYRLIEGIEDWSLICSDLGDVNSQGYRHPWLIEFTGGTHFSLPDCFTVYLIDHLKDPINNIADNWAQEGF